MYVFFSAKATCSLQKPLWVHLTGWLIGISSQWMTSPNTNHHFYEWSSCTCDGQRPPKDTTNYGTFPFHNQPLGVQIMRQILGQIMANHLIAKQHAGRGPLLKPRLSLALIPSSSTSTWRDSRAMAVVGGSAVVDAVDFLFVWSRCNGCSCEVTNPTPRSY